MTEASLVRDLRAAARFGELRGEVEDECLVAANRISGGRGVSGSAAASGDVRGIGGGGVGAPRRRGCSDAPR